MAGATAYEGAAGPRAPTPSSAAEPEQHGGVVTWPPVSRYRTAAPSGAPTLSRARVGTATVPLRSALLRPLAVVDSGRPAHTHLLRTFSGYLAGARATTSGVSRHRWVSSSSSSSPSSPLSIPPVSPRASTGGSSRRPTGNSRAKINEGIGGKN